MNLRSLTDQELWSSAKKAVSRERDATTVVLHHLREIEARRAYGRHSSLYQYTIKELGYL